MKFSLCMASIFSFFLLACEGDILPIHKSSLVVEGYIEAGGHPVVQLSSTIPVSEEFTSFDSIGQYVIRWAHVTINDGKRTISLSGKYDPGYFPPFIYTSTAITGEVGRTYKLEIEYKDLHASSTTTIPAPTQLECIYAVPVEGENYLYSIHAVFNHNVANQRYYKLFTRKTSESKQYLSSFMGILDCTTLPNPADVTVYAGMSADRAKNYDMYFHIGDEVMVKLCALDKTAYQFWYDWSQNENFSSNPVMPSYTNLPSNITGGIGYWFGYGSSTLGTIIVKEQ